MSTAAAADWFPDPANSARLRYWDGTAWTGYLVDLDNPGVVYLEKSPRTPPPAPGSINIPLSVTLTAL